MLKSKVKQTDVARELSVSETRRGQGRDWKAQGQGWELLRSLGCSPQKPERRPTQRNAMLA